MKIAIDVKGYTKKFKSFTSTKDVSFSVKYGTIHGFIGPNGSGKTTTIKAMIGAYIPTDGEILIGNNKAGTVNANRLIGYIPERASFPKHLNAIQYLKAMGEMSGLKQSVSKAIAIKILKDLDLMKYSKRKPINFSSGMQKKILLAQSLLTDPKILILDEPAANLDPSSRQELFDQLVKLKKQGKTIFISSHILAELERFIEEITFIYYGKIIYTGTIDDFSNISKSIFIKVKKQDKLIKYLKSKKINFRNNGVELEIVNINKNKVDLFYKELAKENFKIISYKTNDLQSSYDHISEEENLKNDNKIFVSNEKIYLIIKIKKLLKKIKKMIGGKNDSNI